MKKRVLSILLCLCMVLALCPMTAFADENYMITQNFKYGTRTYDGTDPQTSPYQFVIPAGGSFSLGTIEDCSPYQLVGWKESVSGTVYLPYAEIQNLQSDLTFDAVYQVQGGLTITVNGFMPGKKVGDCTYTVESTIPGVEFSETDILDIQWSKYTFDGNKNDWSEAHKFDVFQADTGYGLVITLNNNDLELVPSTTVNGIVPRHSEIMSNSGGPYAINIECDFGTPAEPTLAITVDGFQVGNTPNDITFSFASTNLGVTFSEENILNVYWEKYVVDGTGYLWTEVKKTEVFQTDTAYRLLLVLNSHLDLAPATTVNGKTPESCEIRYNNGVPIALVIFCEFGTPPMPPLTIDGPDVVCSWQDYAFTVTPPDGVTLDTEFGYDTGMMDSSADLDIDDDGVGHGVVPKDWYNPQTNQFTLTAQGTDPGGNTVPGTKTVQVSPEHLYVDGVCGCGAVQQYTVTYDGGEDSNPVTDVKTHGEDLPLRGETFTMDGFVQTGWVDKEGAVYKLGATYTADQDVTLYPVFEKIITLTVPFTTTVALGDAGEPGETTFELALIDGSGAALTADNVTAAAAVTTDGAGDYTGALTITGPEWTLWRLLSEGAFVQQVNAGEDGWTVDDTVWGVRLYMPEVAARSADEVSYELLLYPTYVMDDGSFNLDLNAGPVDKMTFTNTYTAHVYALNHDADGHWDECAGCKDVQNKEPHKYGDWKVTKEATQTAKGEKEHTCTVCGYTEKAEIPVRTNVPSGDDSSFALWAALFTLSAAAVITTVNVSKKKKADK